MVKQVYRGVIFLYDENDLDNAYFCAKSQMSEKVKHSETACHGKVFHGSVSCHPLTLPVDEKETIFWRCE